MRRVQLLLLPISLSLAFFACRKTEELKTITITGFDTKKCMCCWGWEFKHQGEDYLIGEWPADFPVQVLGDTSTSFPFKVRVELVADQHCNNKFKATQMELVE